jgi:hypothetical protein
MRAGVLLGLRLATAAAFVGTAALAVTLSRGAPTDAALESAKAAGKQHVSVTPPSGTQGARGAPSSNTGSPNTGSSNTGTPGCAASWLRISLGSGAKVANATTRYALEFTNVSAAPCTLAGYPQVAAYQGNGLQVGDVAAHDTSVVASRVLLAPGQTAHAALDSLALAHCRPVRATGLRVVSPGSSGPRYVRRSLTACAAGAGNGQAYLHVRPIQAGTGPA